MVVVIFIIKKDSHLRDVSLICWYIRYLCYSVDSHFPDHIFPKKIYYESFSKMKTQDKGKANKGKQTNPDLEMSGMWSGSAMGNHAWRPLPTWLSRTRLAPPHNIYPAVVSHPLGSLKGWQPNLRSARRCPQSTHAPFRPTVRTRLPAAEQAVQRASRSWVLPLWGWWGGWWGGSPYGSFLTAALQARLLKNKWTKHCVK